MKDRLTAWLVLIIVFSIIFSPNTFLRFVEYVPRKYSINAVLYPQNFTLDVTIHLYYINDKERSFDKLYFHFFPNSLYFRKYGSKVIRFEIFGEGGKLDFRFKNSDESVIEVGLREKLNPFEVIELTFNFRLLIPRIRGRFGYYNGVFAFGNWYPILAVYDEGGWNLYPYVVYGESFYSEVASYDVAISVPSSFIVAATGDLVEEYVKDNRTVYRWKVDLARDFAWTASERYVARKLVSTLGDREIKVFVYLFEEYGRFCEDVSIIAFNALRVYSDLFGPYPYSSFKLCQVFGDFAGMEYPGLVMLSDNAFTSKELLELVVAHETAHQWWYNIVGNDQASEPWLDEALAEYSQFLYFEYMYDARKFREIYRRYLLDLYYSSFVKESATPRSSVLNFSSEREYINMVYLRGAATLHMLRLLVGDEVFLKSLKTYYSSFYFKVAKTKDFKLIFEKTSGLDLDWFFEQWLERSDTPSLELVYAKAVWDGNAYTLRLYIRQLNVSEPYRLYVPLAILTSNGRKEKTIKIDKLEEEVILRVDDFPIIVELDPEDDILGRDFILEDVPEVVLTYNYQVYMLIFAIFVLVYILILVGRIVLRRRAASRAN